MDVRSILKTLKSSNTCARNKQIVRRAIKLTGTSMIQVNNISINMKRIKSTYDQFSNISFIIHVSNAKIIHNFILRTICIFHIYKYMIYQFLSTSHSPYFYSCHLGCPTTMNFRIQMFYHPKWPKNDGYHCFHILPSRVA